MDKQKGRNALLELICLIEKGERSGNITLGRDEVELLKHDLLCISSLPSNRIVGANEIAALEKRVGENGADYQKLDEAHDRLNQRFEDAMGENQRLKNEATTIVNATDRLTAHVDLLRKQLIERNNACSNLAGEATTLRKANKNLTERCAKRRELYRELYSKNDTLREKNGELGKTKSHLKNRIGELRKEITAKEEEIMSAMSKGDGEWKRIAEELQTKNKDLRDNFNNLRHKNKVQAALIKNLQSKFKEGGFVRTINALEKEVETKDEALQAFAVVGNGVDAVTELKVKELQNHVRVLQQLNASSNADHGQQSKLLTKEYSSLQYKAQDLEKYITTLKRHLSEKGNEVKKLKGQKHVAIPHKYF